jgi:hypothetical protein
MNIGFFMNNLINFIVLAVGIYFILDLTSSKEKTKKRRIERDIYFDTFIQNDLVFVKLLSLIENNKILKTKNGDYTFRNNEHYILFKFNGLIINNVNFHFNGYKYNENKLFQYLFNKAGNAYRKRMNHENIVTDLLEKEKIAVLRKELLSGEFNKENNLSLSKNEDDNVIFVDFGNNENSAS